MAMLDPIRLRSRRRPPCDARAVDSPERPARNATGSPIRSLLMFYIVELYSELLLARHSGLSSEEEKSACLAAVRLTYFRTMFYNIEHDGGNGAERSSRNGEACRAGYTAGAAGRLCRRIHGDDPPDHGARHQQSRSRLCPDRRTSGRSTRWSRSGPIGGDECSLPWRSWRRSPLQRCRQGRGDQIEGRDMPCHPCRPDGGAEGQSVSASPRTDWQRPAPPPRRLACHRQSLR